MTTRKLNGPYGGDYQTDGLGNAVAVTESPLTYANSIDGRLDTAEAWAARPSSYGGLDLWAAFNAEGGTNSWAATTYGAWVTGLATHFAVEITAEEVTVADLGESSGAGLNVYAYTAGSGPYKVLLVSGQHGAETLGQWATMRWFEGFVRSDDPSYAALRRLLTVTWIPTANPYNYNAGRKNGNSVDINRNYDLLWDRYDDGGGAEQSTYKGESAESEPETQMIASLLAANDYRVVLDCHNFSPASDEGQLYLPGSWYLGARQLGVDALRTWASLYGDGFDTSFLAPTATEPTLHNYANYVMRHENDRPDAASATLEMNADAAESTATLITAAGMRAYCGLIHTYIGLWAARVGDPLSLPFTCQYWAGLTIQSDSTSVASGGGLVDTGSSTYTALSFIDRRPAAGQNAGSVLSIPVIAAPALVTFELNARMATLANGAGRFEFTVEIDGVSSPWTAVLSTGATSTDASNASVSGFTQYTAISNTTVPVVRVLVRKISGGAAALRTVTIAVTVTPLAYGVMTPYVNGA